MTPTPLRPGSPLGVEVADLDLRGVDDADLDALVRLLAEHGVVVLADQVLDDAAFTEVLGRLGDLVFTTGETPVPGHPDLNVISNVGRTTPPRSTFHTDSSYFASPPTYTALRAVTIPTDGGETLFSDQYAALVDLDPDLRTAVEGRRIRHVVTGLDLGDDDETEAWHPVVQRHPVSGREAIYLSSPARCVAVEGLGEEEGRALVQRLFEHCTRDDNVLRHRWRPRDVVIWDNRCVLHRADHSATVGDRVMHRGMVVEHSA
jgi:taurine dioxygenase